MIVGDEKSAQHAYRDNCSNTNTSGFGFPDQNDECDPRGSYFACLIQFLFFSFTSEKDLCHLITSKAYSR